MPHANEEFTVTYGRSVPSIADQLYGGNKEMSQEDKVKEAQKVYDGVMLAFPSLRDFMIAAQNSVKKKGYTETILGRRRHLPDMQLNEFEFEATSDYVNPDVDPLDLTTFSNDTGIPERVLTQLQNEFKGYKYFGQIVKRTKELREEGIRVINNRAKINDATRQVINSIIQGSAADQTKLAMLQLENDPRWQELGGRLLVPVHDELICEVPIEYAEEAGKLLSQRMCDAASFLPFPSKCDVTITYRWYGLDHPCPFDKPETLDRDSLTESNIQWLQYMLVEMEYILPIHKEELGDLLGMQNSGVDGIWSDTIESSIEDYCKRFRVAREDFIDHIARKVVYGDN